MSHGKVGGKVEVRKVTSDQQAQAIQVSVPSTLGNEMASSRGTPLDGKPPRLLRGTHHTKAAACHLLLVPAMAQGWMILSSLPFFRAFGSKL